METNPISLRVTSTRRPIAAAGDVDVRAYTVRAAADLTGDTVTLRYDEPADANLGRTTTTVVAEGNVRVRVTRRGDYRSDMEFLPGKATDGVAETGVFPIAYRLVTKRVENLFRVAGRLSVEYLLCVGGTPDARMTITFERQGKGENDDVV